VLVRLGRALPELVLVGGQAVNYWAMRYRDGTEELAGGPFTSKDIDLHGSRDIVPICAEVLNGEFRLPTMDDVQVSAGLVLYTDRNGVARQLDILNLVHGLDETSIRQTAVSVPLADGTEVRVMHPLLCMQSRVHNVMTLSSKYDTPHGLRQLRASIVCLREYVIEMLDKGGDPREALNIHKTTFRFCTAQIARRLFRTKGIDPFDAVRPHPRLPGNFGTKCYPTWLRRLAVLRQ
jgi:hypothetical protein